VIVEEMKTQHIAVDAMGGDHAPEEIVAGAFDAARTWPEFGILLVGDQEQVERVLKSRSAGARPENVGVIHAPSVITMEDSPIDAIRKKPDSSIVLSAELVRRGEAGALVSAGNTGACVAVATLSLGLLAGVKRPGIAVMMPTTSGWAVMIDAGANISCKPAHLLQYGAMGAVYSKNIFGFESPRVGLLNIGIEDAKGNELVKLTRALFQKSKLNFIGNIEGQDIFRGDCNVVVCEGFVGNLILKAVEGAAEAMMTLLAQSLAKVPAGDAASQCAVDPVAILREKLDYAEYGGAPLLGLNGVCIICHGRSRSRAICNAIKLAADIARRQVNDQIVGQVRALPVS
jgi:glycerol-3-phosphate acyltransferase PlsX